MQWDHEPDHGQDRIQAEGSGCLGEKDGAKLDKLGASVLGLGFSTERDQLMVKSRANTGQRKRGNPIEPDWSRDSVQEVGNTILTMRLALGVANSQYDPLGVASPINIRLKVALREMHRRKLDWDEPLPLDLQELFVDLIIMLVEAGEVKFDRCVRPTKTVGRSSLLVFWDGSNEAFATAIYIRWELSGGGLQGGLVSCQGQDILHVKHVHSQSGDELCSPCY